MDGVGFPGLAIDGYEIVRGLGSGGMAQTWLCRRPGAREASQLVVLKVLKPELVDDPAYQTMFLDEARIGALLQHRNIPRVLHHDAVQGVPYMVQEYVEGPRLTELLSAIEASRRLDVALGCRVVADVAEALDYIHRGVRAEGRTLQLVHRDVSTTNVIVSVTGVTALIDFGIAYSDDRADLTEVGIRKGKLRYMAPEYATGSGELTPASDVFALGVVLYAAVTGHFPWRSDALLAAQVGNYPTPDKHNPSLHPRLNHLILCSLNPVPGYRPTASDVRTELEAIASLDGGLLTDRAVAARVQALFPRGPSDWQPRRQPDSRTLHSMATGESWVPLLTGTAASRVMPAPPPRRFDVRWALLGALLTFLFVLSAGGAGLSWLVLNAEPEPEERVVVAPLLDEVEAMLGQGNARAALDLLEQARALGPSDNPSRIRLSRLASTARRLDYRHAAAVAVEQGTPEQAREAVHELLREFPSDEQGIAWLQDLRRERKRPVRRVTGPAPGRLLVTSTRGALLTIDDEPIGTLPEAGDQPLDPGRHTVTLSQEGYESLVREVRIAPGQAYALDAALEPLPEEVELAAVEPEAAPAPAPPEPPPVAPAAAPDVVSLAVRQQVALDFPKDALSASGPVRCTAFVSVDERGAPTAVRVEDDPVCTEPFQVATREGLMRWRWHPDRQDKEKVAAVTSIVVRYERGP